MPQEEADWRATQRQVVADLYRESYGRFVSLAWVILGRHTIAEDVVQDAFANAYRREEPFQDLDLVERYLARSVVNGARTALRRDARVRDARVLLGSELETLATSPDTDGQVLHDRDAVRRALDTLPRRQRECAVCHFLFGLSHRETSEVLGMRVGTVKTHIQRARAVLIAELGDDT